MRMDALIRAVGRYLLNNNSVMKTWMEEIFGCLFDCFLEFSYEGYLLQIPLKLSLFWQLKMYFNNKIDQVESSIEKKHVSCIASVNLKV